MYIVSGKSPNVRIIFLCMIWISEGPISQDEKKKKISILVVSLNNQIIRCDCLG